MDERHHSLDHLSSKTSSSALLSLNTIPPPAISRFYDKESSVWPSLNQDNPKSFAVDTLYSMEAIKPSYKTLPLADDYDGSEVSTEVDEALMSDEHQWHSKALESAKYRRHNTWTSKLRSYRWLVDTFLLFIILMLLVILLLRNDSREGWRGSGLQIGGDYKGAGPICQLH